MIYFVTENLKCRKFIQSYYIIFFFKIQYFFVKIKKITRIKKQATSKDAAYILVHNEIHSSTIRSTLLTCLKITLFHLQFYYIRSHEHNDRSLNI